MAIPVTQRARSESEKPDKKLNIILQIDGVKRLYTALLFKKVLQIGDPDFIIGDDFQIGGLIDFNTSSLPIPIEIGEFEIGDGTEIGDKIDPVSQADLISFQSGTSTDISQKIHPDTGEGDTVTRFQVALVDKNQEISNLIAPGNVVEDLLGSSARIWFGYQNSAFPEDYIIVHRGIIDDFKSGPGLVTVNVASQDQKKRSELFLAAETELSAPISDVDVTAPVDDTSDFLEKITGANGLIDSAFRTYVRIDDEVIEYQTVDGTNFLTLTRGSLNTNSAAHSSGASVSSFYRMGPDNVMDIALKIMLSGFGGPYKEDIDIENFVRVDNETLVANAIFIEDNTFLQVVNPRVGDFVTVVDATNAQNNVTDVEIVAVTSNVAGFYLTLDDSVTLLEEIDSPGLLSLRSQFDVWPDGLSMTNEEVDIEEHQTIKSNFLSSTEMDFYLKDSFDGKEFLTDQIYNPVSCIALPRKAQASVAIQRPPVPGEIIKTLSSANVLNVDKLKLERTINKRFFNVIKYDYEEEVLEERFVKKERRINADSIQRIKVGRKELSHESKGLRDLLGAKAIIDEASQRRLNKYKFGAEFIRGVKVNNELGFNIEAGDGIIVDMDSLQLSDSASGTREGEQRIFDITNKSFSIKSGQITLDIEDTNVDKNLRFGLISPSSFVKSATSTTRFIIKPSFNTEEFGNDEFRKWDNFGLNTAIIVRSEDYSVVSSAILQGFSGNTVTLKTPLAFVPTEDMILELDEYNQQPDNVKLIYAFMNENPLFDDDGVPYVMF